MAAVKPSPPPPPVPTRIVFVVLALVRVVLAPTLAPPLVRRIAVEALPYLGFAALWVVSAAAATKAAGIRAWGDAEGPAPSVYLQAHTDGALVSLIILQTFSAGMLYALFQVYVVATVSGSGPELRKRASGAFNPEFARRVIMRTVVFGSYASMPFILMILAGSLVECMKSKEIGSLMLAVGTFGLSAVPFLVIMLVLLGEIVRLEYNTFADDDE